MANQSNNCSNVSTNGTIDIDEFARQSGSEIISGFAYLLCALIGAPANIYVIYQLVARKLRKTSEVKELLLNLAIADTFVTLIHCVVEASWTFTNQWLGGDFLCRFFSFFRSFGTEVRTFIPC